MATTRPQRKAAHACKQRITSHADPKTALMQLYQADIPNIAESIK